MLHLPGKQHVCVTCSSAGELLINQIIKDGADYNALKEAQHRAVTFIYNLTVKHIILHKP